MMTTRIFLTLFFDGKLQFALEQLQRQTRSLVQFERVQNAHRPHITLAAYDISDMDKMETILSEFCDSVEKFPVEFRGLGIFPQLSCLYASPVVDSRMLSVHDNLLSVLDRDVLFPHHLAVGKWIPHCELAVGIPMEQFVLIYKQIADCWKNLSGFASGIGLLVQPSVEDRKHYRFTSTKRAI